MQALGRLTGVMAAALAATGISACAGEELAEPEVEGIMQNIISNDKIDDENINLLGLVRVETTAGFCSGVLLGPRRVLTAQHCNSQAGTRVIFMGTRYSAVETFEPGPELDTPWGTRDMEILALDRDVINPVTRQPWQLRAELRQMDINTQVGGDFICFGIGANQVIDGRATGNPGREFYGALRSVKQIEDGVTYRIEPGLEPGDSGGPCFPLIFSPGDGPGEVWLISINGSSVYNEFPDGTRGPGLSAALTATGEAGIHAWIVSHM